jgi:hypothetical protein
MRRDARRVLLGGLIDHAPVYPPASLPLLDALADHRRARESADSWLVRRFVCPAARLDELAGEALRLSVVLDHDVLLPEDDRIEAVEAAAVPTSSLVLGREIYVELAPGDGVEEQIAELAAAGLRAKVRCGGPQIPSVEALAQFVRACREAQTVFKATAGLHHAYPTAGEHGFLNLLAAATFGNEEQALAEQDREAFALTTERFSWRDRRAGPDELADVRRDLFSGIGSCSFDEPVGELRGLGILPA